MTPEFKNNTEGLNQELENNNINTLLKEILKNNSKVSDIMNKWNPQIDENVNLSEIKKNYENIKRQTFEAKEELSNEIQHSIETQLADLLQVPLHNKLAIEREYSWFSMQTEMDKNAVAA